MIISVPFGIFALLYGQIFISGISFFINAHYTGKFIKYNAFEQLKDFLPIVILAVFASAIMYILDSFGLNHLPDIFRILIGIFAGLIVYLGLAFLFKMDSLTDLRNLIFKK